MYKCNAWELWRIQNPFADVLVIVNLDPMEGLPVVDQQIDWKISIYFREEDLAERVGEVDESEMAWITREYLRTRAWDQLIHPFFGDQIINPIT